MRVWAVSNQKGGVGKTTTVVTLGGILASRGYRTLLIDLDPHGSLTSYFRMNPDQIDFSVYNLFQDVLAKKKLLPSPYIVSTEFEGLSVLPAATAIATVERQGGAGGMGLVVANGLSAVRKQYDFVLIDSPPMLGVLMVNALAACEHLFVPVLSEFLALKGLERMLNTLEMIGRSRKTKLNYTIVPTLFDRRTRASIQTLRVMRERYGDQVWGSVVPVDTQVREASDAGIPLSHYMPKSKAVMAYTELLEHMFSQDQSRRIEPALATA
ncbi:ParA family protein [Methylocaldum sp.]|uniref:ParA family protein n=1 Tax=Methylocaldum sp. TaxID=1969727 RepID=UPI002D670DC7|nr:ParA family protein [Methylocaldum sp.]HYE36804.1 ParA family protein [Methylocaldum sp.]